MRLMVSALVSFLSVNTVFAADVEAQYAAVRALGTLNGVALQCRSVGEVRRMKAAVVDSAPKERSFGLAFEESTNEAFLAFIRRADTCPGPAALSAQVDAAIQEMRRAFGKE